ncbi:MAG: D-2-hydroxyacid dehydrogenase [Cyclobacteriaceae bacterium]
MAKIVILEAHNSNPGDLSWEEIEKLGCVTIYQRTTQDQIIERAAEADILITNKLKISAEILGHLPQLQLVHQLATGTDNIDKEAAKKQGVEVMNAVGYSTTAVAQHVFALILEITSLVAVHNSAVKSGEWSKSGDWCYMLKTPVELTGKNLGVIGFGKIGQAVAKLGLAFGMNVLVYSNHATASQYTDVTIVGLNELAQQSDFVSLHSPLTDKTEGIIDHDFLSKMKSTAFLINTARGGHVVEKDLYDALKNEKIAGAGLDVTSQEPIESDNPLLTLDNCIITPHIAWTAFESRRRLIGIVAQNIRSFLEA